MYKLLLAEDEYIELVAMKQIIGRKYADVYEIYEATNGIEAVEQAVKLKPDMIFMDIKMPGIKKTSIQLVFLIEEKRISETGLSF